MSLFFPLQRHPNFVCYQENVFLLFLNDKYFISLPNISSIVGEMYPKNDPRHDGGFTILYMGINLGAFIANQFAGTLGEKIGWRWGFWTVGDDTGSHYFFVEKVYDLIFTLYIGYLIN